eukprot:scaffold156546_cov17-Prasinocladus_malaysianus.AAC.1
MLVSVEAKPASKASQDYLEALIEKLELSSDYPPSVLKNLFDARYQTSVEIDKLKRIAEGTNVTDTLAQGLQAEFSLDADQVAEIPTAAAAMAVQRELRPKRKGVSKQPFEASENSRKRGKNSTKCCTHY